MRRSIALRTIAMALAAPILFVGTLSAQEIIASRVQAESKTQASTTRIFQPGAEPVGNTTPNALRHDGNVTVTYDVSVPAGASVNAVKVRSRCASTCTGGVRLFVVVNGSFQAGKNVAANAQTFTERTWTLANPLGPGTHRIGLRTESTTTTNRVINDYLYLDGTNTPAQLLTHQARTAQSFIDSLGVDTQLKDQSSVYGQYSTVIKPALSELGIKHVRDSAVQPSNATIYNRYADLCASLGIRYTLNINDNLWTQAPTSAQFDQIVSNAGCAVEMFEGPNEYNNGRIGDGVWDEELEAWQKDIFNNVNASSHPEIPVLSAPLGKGDNNIPPPEEMPELGPYSDLNGMHSYPAGAMPTGSHRPEYQSTIFDLHLPQAVEVGEAGRSTYPSETGYTTAARHVNRVSETARTKYLPRLSFEYFNAAQTHNIQRAHIFQLADHDPPDPNVATTAYGLLDYQGSWTPAGKVVENMVDVMDEPSGTSYLAGSLGYEITGDGRDVHTALVQKRDGAFYLALWKEVSSYNRDTDQDISVAPDNVTIKFESPKNLAVFEPSDVANWAIGQDAEANPERTLSGMSITEPVDDAVTIIRIT